MKKILILLLLIISFNSYCEWKARLTDSTAIFYWRTDTFFIKMMADSVVLTANDPIRIENLLNYMDSIATLDSILAKLADTSEVLRTDLMRKDALGDSIEDRNLEDSTTIDGMIKSITADSNFFKLNGAVLTAKTATELDIDTVIADTVSASKVNVTNLWMAANKLTSTFQELNYLDGYVPTSTQIVYGNGSKLTSSSDLTYNGSVFNVNDYFRATSVKSSGRIYSTGSTTTDDLSTTSGSIVISYNTSTSKGNINTRNYTTATNLDMDFGAAGTIINMLGNVDIAGGLTAGTITSDAWVRAEEIGIKTSPTQELDVNGDVNVADSTFLNDNLRIKYDASNYTDLYTESDGDFVISPTGDTIHLKANLDVGNYNITQDTSKADVFKFNSAKTYYYSINPAQWSSKNPDVDDVYKGLDSTFVDDIGGWPFIVGINLPNGAIVIDVVVYGNDATETWEMKRQVLSTGIVSSMATANINTNDNTITNPTIDNSIYSYGIETSEFESTTPPDAIYGARITYTLSEL